MMDGETIKIDGHMTDGVWARVKPTGDFTQYMPNPGKSPSQQTEVRIAYDDSNIYVFARMYDSAPDSILKQISGRDRMDNTDEFGMWFSTYNDGNNAFAFSTNPEGVQLDRVITQDNSDRSWNTAWRVETAIDEKGWTAEFQIPFSQIRFAKIDEGFEQVWGVNFSRGIRRNRETDYWNPVDPARDGFEINDSGELRGLTNITPPPRLTLYPYVSAYAITDEEEGVGYDFNGGLDLKAGIGEAFTMDMTLIPDFGQVVADNLVLNLSPYEVQLADNRPFFTEGTEIFNKTNLFYSRRVGEDEKLINATKLSGRTKDGLGVGAFQAFSVDTLNNNALTSYSIIALDQNLKNNSFVHGISTLVNRSGDVNDALAQALLWGLRDEDNKYQISGSGAYNQIFTPSPQEEDFGYSWSLGVSKITGKFTFEYEHAEESEYYNINDMGYLQAPNEVTDLLFFNYRNIEPTKNFIRIGGSAGIIHSQLHTPRVNTFSMVSLEGFGLTSNFQFAKVSLESQFLSGRDYFESRIQGKYWVTPKWIGPTAIISTDYRKRFAIDINYTKGFVEDELKEWNIMDLGISPRFRVNDRLNFIYSFIINDKYDERGYADDFIVDGEEVGLFSKRDFLTQIHVLTSTFALSNKATIDARVRHYWSSVDAKELFELQDDGSLIPADLDMVAQYGESTYDKSYNAWSVDLGLRWFFSPGSELSIVWKNTLYSNGSQLPNNYFENWEQMLEEMFTNSLSFKALFFLDYNTVKKAKFSKKGG